MTSASVIVVFILAICIVVATAKFIYEPRIVNGKNATDGQFPYQAVLYSTADGKLLCGASILNKRFLLTAAHCTANEWTDPASMYAVIGTTNRLSGGTKINFDKITPHKEWNDELEINDISLIRTAKEIIFSNFIQPIALPKHNMPAEGGSLVIVSGWGRTITESDEKPDRLQFVEQQTISTADCKKRFEVPPFVDWVTDKTVCAIGDGDSGTCSGDSGGPLVHITDENHTVLVGIVSWGIPCAQGFPDAYTRVYSHLDWIQEHIEIQSVDL